MIKVSPFLCAINEENVECKVYLAFTRVFYDKLFGPEVSLVREGGFVQITQKPWFRSFLFLFSGIIRVISLVCLFGAYIIQLFSVSTGYRPYNWAAH